MNAILLSKKSLGYQHIPKVACTSIKYALYQLRTGKEFSEEKAEKNIHDYFWNEHKDISEANFRFIVLRDPIKRFLSAYSNRVTHHKELSKEFLEKKPAGKLLLSKKEIPINPSLHDFIKYFKEYQTIPTINHHTKPIIEFGIKDLDFFTHIYKMEELARLESDILKHYNTDFKLPRLQTGGIKFKVSDLNEDEMEFLLDYYKEDYRLLSKYYTKEMILEEWKSQSSIENRYSKREERMKTLYLHIGYYKTATTSIQKTIYSSRDTLKELDYLYPKCWSDNHTISACSAFRDTKKPIHKFHIKKNRTVEQVHYINHNNKENIMKEVNESTCNNIIISGEGIIDLDQEELEDLKTFIQTELNISKIIVVVSVRDVVSQATSGLQERAKSGNNNMKAKGKDIFVEKIARAIDIYGKENLKVYKFEDACQNEFGPVGHFCEQIGIPKESIEKLNIVKQNESISNKAVDLLQFINKKIPLINDGALSKGRSDKDTEALHSIRGGKFILPTDIQEKLIKESKEDREWLKDTFGIDYDDAKIKEPLVLVYDELYYEDIVSVYPKLSPTIQELTQRYIKNKKNQVEDIVSQDTLEKLLLWIRRYHKSTPEHKLQGIVKLFEDESLPTSASLYREIALISEKDNQIETALYFMKKAQSFKSNGKVINKKIEEYEEAIQKKISTTIAI